MKAPRACIGADASFCTSTLTKRTKSTRSVAAARRNEYEATETELKYPTTFSSSKVHVSRIAQISCPESRTGFCKVVKFNIRVDEVQVRSLVVDDSPFFRLHEKIYEDSSSFAINNRFSLFDDRRDIFGLVSKMIVD